MLNPYNLDLSILAKTYPVEFLLSYFNMISISDYDTSGKQIFLSDTLSSYYSKIQTISLANILLWRHSIQLSRTANQLRTFNAEIRCSEALCFLKLLKESFPEFACDTDKKVINLKAPELVGRDTATRNTFSLIYPCEFHFTNPDLMHQYERLRSVYETVYPHIINARRTLEEFKQYIGTT